MVQNGSATSNAVNSAVTGNTSPFGGIINEADQGDATLSITNSVVSANSGAGGSPPTYFGAAGGIANYGTVVITNSTVSDNLAANDSGGISNFGTLTVANSAVTGNRAGGVGGTSYPGSGGGISSAGTLIISNSTISGNAAVGNPFKGFGGGGGIVNYGGDSTATINNSTLSGNSADIGGGVSNVAAFVEISNVIFDAGTLGENIFNDSGTVVSDGYNLSSDDGGGYLNGPDDKVNTEPMLGPLQDNGGPTPTHAPLPGSPAIDMGDPNFAAPPYYDQRGPRFIRVFNSRIDVGSFETQPSPPPFPTPKPHLTPSSRPTPH